MKIKVFQGGFDKNLSYLIWCDKTNIAAIIDPAVEINPIIEYITSHNLILSKILITHTHHDHIFYLEDFKYLFPNLEIVCSNITKNETFNFNGVEHKEIISIGEEIIICLHTPGHFYNSICYWNKNNSILFTGDTMFVGRTGRTIGAKSNISHLYTSIYDKLLILPPQTIIYSGHHYGFKKIITLKENVRLSSFFQCNSESEFIQVMKQYEKNR